MASIFATTAEVQMLVGANASATSNVVGHIDVYMEMAEAFINTATGYNFSDAYATLSADVKGILKQAAASFAAMMVINYDLSGFFTQREVETRLDVLDNSFNKCLALLKQQAATDFIKGAT